MSDSSLRIRKVIYNAGYEMDILLVNGQHVKYDIGRKLETARFQELKDQEVFQTGYIRDGRCICWKTGAELSLDEIMLYRNAKIDGRNGSNPPQEWRIE